MQLSCNSSKDYFPVSKLRLNISVLAAIAIAEPAMAETDIVDGIPPVSIATSMPADGDPTGSRRWLAQHGITYGLIYTGEALGNVPAGLRRGSLYQGKLEAFAAVDSGSSPDGRA